MSAPIYHTFLKIYTIFYISQNYIFILLMQICRIEFAFLIYDTSPDIFVLCSDTFLKNTVHIFLQHYMADCTGFLLLLSQNNYLTPLQVQQTLAVL